MLLYWAHADAVTCPDATTCFAYPANLFLPMPQRGVCMLAIQSCHKRVIAKMLLVNLKRRPPTWSNLAAASTCAVATTKDMTSLPTCSEVLFCPESKLDEGSRDCCKCCCCTSDNCRSSLQLTAAINTTSTQSERVLQQGAMISAASAPALSVNVTHHSSGHQLGCADLYAACSKCIHRVHSQQNLHLLKCQGKVITVSRTAPFTL